MINLPARQLMISAAVPHLEQSFHQYGSKILFSTFSLFQLPHNFLLLQEKLYSKFSIISVLIDS